MCYRMRKLLYIPCSQDGFLPSCYSPLSCSGLPPLHNNMLDSISQLIQCIICTPEFQWFFWCHAILAWFSTKVNYIDLIDRKFFCKISFGKQFFRMWMKYCKDFDHYTSLILAQHPFMCIIMHFSSHYTNNMQRLPKIIVLCNASCKLFLFLSSLSAFCAH